MFTSKFLLIRYLGTTIQPLYKNLYRTIQWQLTFISLATIESCIQHFAYYFLIKAEGGNALYEQ